MIQILVFIQIGLKFYNSIVSDETRFSLQQFWFVIHFIEQSWGTAELVSYVFMPGTIDEIENNWPDKQILWSFLCDIKYREAEKL